MTGDAVSLFDVISIHGSAIFSIVSRDTSENGQQIQVSVTVISRTDKYVRINLHARLPIRKDLFAIVSPIIAVTDYRGTSLVYSIDTIRLILIFLTIIKFSKMLDYFLNTFVFKFFVRLF